MDHFDDKMYPWSVVDETGQIWDQSSSERRGRDRLWEIVNEDPNSKGHTFTLVNDRPWIKQ